MKILLTVHQFFPDYISGTEVLTYSVAKELVARGYQVVVFTGYPARIPLPDHKRVDQYNLEGIQVHRFHHAHTPMGNQHVASEIEYCNILAASYFRSLLLEHTPDVIHYFHLSRLSGLLIDIGLQLNIPSFFTPTDFWMICPTSQLLLSDGSMCEGPGKFGSNCIKHVAEITRKGFVPLLMKKIPDKAMEIIVRSVNRASFIKHPLRAETIALSKRKSFLLDRLNSLDKIIAPTRVMKEALLSNGVDENKLLLSAYGIDTTPFKERRKQRQLGKHLNIGFIGTLSTHKGCHVLIEAVSQLPEKSYYLKIYGSPSHFPDYYAQLEKLAAGNSAIEFCGTFPNSIIGEILSDLDVLVVPSLWYENAPLVIYSAMASGCPTIVSDFPGMTETVRHEINGLAFPSGDRSQLAACLLRLIREPGLLHNLSGNCRPPKSVIEYVSELVELYGSELRQKLLTRKPLDGMPFIPSYDFNKHFSITGWAFPRNKALKRIELRDDNEVVATISAFGKRADVVNAYQKSKIATKSSKIGFSIAFEQSISQYAQLLITTSDDVTTIIPLDRLAAHSVVDSESIFLGVDILQLPPQSHQPTSKRAKPE